jgi:hypothetical protein
MAGGGAGAFQEEDTQQDGERGEQSDDDFLAPDVHGISFPSLLSRPLFSGLSKQTRPEKPLFPCRCANVVARTIGERARIVNAAEQQGRRPAGNNARMDPFLSERERTLLKDLHATQGKRLIELVLQKYTQRELRRPR